MAFFTAIVFDFLGYRGVFTQQGRESKIDSRPCAIGY